MSSVFNLEKSQELAKQIAVNSRDCFQNALRGLERCEKAVFVVGLVRDVAGKEEPTEHAWLEVGEEIIDPTYAVCLSKEQIAQTVYQPLKRVCRDEALKNYGKWLSERTRGVLWCEIIPAEVWNEAKQTNVHGASPTATTS